MTYNTSHDNTTKQFMTIREVANTGFMREGTLRRLQKQGEIPGIYAETRFYVNFPQLVKKYSA
jgi:hypothetical protein